MQHLIYRFILISAFILNTSCTKSYYIQPENTPVATVSFSNLSDEIADLYIISNDIQYTIKNEVIEKKHPEHKSKYKTNVFAGNKITFKYEYNWIISERTEITTTYSHLNIPSNVSSKSVKDISACSKTVSFMPEEDKHYEVYFGVFSNKCIIKASESIETKDSKNILVSIKTL